MSNVILVCYRDKSQNKYTPNAFGKVSENISADNVTATHEEINQSGLQISIIDRVSYMQVKGMCVCLGLLVEKHDEWFRLGSGRPDGAFAIFRSDDRHVELVTDTLGQRTIWYAQTESTFIASTSQRAIVLLLGGFRRNKSVYPWMLATGSLGPMLSWDKRIHMTPPNSVLSLNRETWKINIDREELPFVPGDGSYEIYENRFRTAIEDTFAGIDLDCSKLILPLSGGYDSRAILMMLSNKDNLKCFTVAPNFRSKYSTRSITLRLAEHYNIPIRFLEYNSSAEPIRDIFTRFITTCEGRFDGLSGYQDGFATLKKFRLEGIQAVLWGDEVYGWKEFKTFFEVKSRLGLFTLSEYQNLPNPSELEIDDVQWPEGLLHRPWETPCCWFGRMYQDFRVPLTLSARVDSKSRYLEVLNPLMSRKLIVLARELPDELRQYKRLCANVVTAMSPDIPFNSSVTHDGKYRSPEKNNTDIFFSAEGREVLYRELDSVYAKNLLSRPLVDFLINGMIVRESKSVLQRVKKIAGPFVPKFARVKLSKVRKTENAAILPINKLAFRAYIIVRMSKLLEEDSKANLIRV